MKIQELEVLKPYRITKSSSDGTFVVDEIIWVSDNCFYSKNVYKENEL